MIVKRMAWPLAGHPSYLSKASRASRSSSYTTNAVPVDRSERS